MNCISAANSYSLPYMIGKTVQSSKQQAPCYSLTGRSNVGAFCEDLAKVISEIGNTGEFVCHKILTKDLMLFNSDF